MKKEVLEQFIQQYNKSATRKLIDLQYIGAGLYAPVLEGNIQSLYSISRRDILKRLGLNHVV